MAEQEVKTSRSIVGHNGTLYPVEEMIENFLGVTALVGPQTWDDLSKVLTKTIVSGMDESGDKPTSFEALILGPQKFVVRVEDRGKLPE